MLQTCRMRWTVLQFDKRGLNKLCRIVLEKRLGYNMCGANFLYINYVWVKNRRFRRTLNQTDKG